MLIYKIFLSNFKSKNIFYNNKFQQKLFFSDKNGTRYCLLVENAIFFDVKDWELWRKSKLPNSVVLCPKKSAS